MSVCSKDTKKKKKEKVEKVKHAKKPVVKVKVKNPDGKELTEEQVEALQNR
jgi:predicted DNA binding protein